MRYLYLKETKVKKGQPSYVSTPDIATKTPGWLRFLPTLLVVVGLFMLASAAAPIVYYQFLYSPSFSGLAKPVSDDYLVSAPATTAVQEVLGKETSVDMNRISNWFPTAQRATTPSSKITHYTLSIPKLKIKDAVVEVGGDDLKESLIQYGGTALPGQNGNAVVFGHSALPQFFSPTNYQTIFTTLPSLKEKDKISVDFDGVTYQYLVEDSYEVQPDDVSVLGQRYDDSYLTLITCVPPGTYLRRLVVNAKLVSNENFRR